MSVFIRLNQAKGLIRRLSDELETWVEDSASEHAVKGEWPAQVTTLLREARAFTATKPKTRRRAKVTK